MRANVYTMHRCLYTHKPLLVGPLPVSPTAVPALLAWELGPFVPGTQKTFTSQISNVHRCFSLPIRQMVRREPLEHWFCCFLVGISWPSRTLWDGMVFSCFLPRLSLPLSYWLNWLEGIQPRNKGKMEVHHPSKWLNPNSRHRHVWVDKNKLVFVVIAIVRRKTLNLSEQVVTILALGWSPGFFQFSIETKQTRK